VQQELRRLAHRADEEQQADQGERVGVEAEEMDALADQRRRLREHGLEIDRIHHYEQRENPEREAEVADPIDDERLDRRRVRLGLVIPEADQQVAHQADAFPAEEQLDQVVGGHQHQHREGKEREIGEEARPVRVLGHVADRIKVHERRDGGDDDEHHRRERIDAQRPFHVQVAGNQPRGQHHAGVLVAEAHLHERDPGEHHRGEQKHRRHQLGRARANQAAEQAGDGRAEQG
jgi:hypothetical protein